MGTNLICGVNTMPIDNKLFRGVEHLGGGDGSTFVVGKVDAYYNYDGAVALWDHHNESNTIHMSEQEALGMVKAILDIIEERRSDRPTVAPF